MAMTDVVADMLTRIRNANQRRHQFVTMPASNKKVDIAKVLQEEGFIIGYKVQDLKSNKKDLTIELKYKENLKAITGLKRISKPGLKVYVSKDEIPYVCNGLGIAIISTSKGLLTDREARKEKIGGEVVAYVW